MAMQQNAAGLDFWRLMTGIGLGVELVTADAYLCELVPAAVRGRAFAVNQFITYLAVPVIALIAWQLVPIAPLGVDGWRWVVVAGASGALVIWFIRSGLPESPRWLAAQGRLPAAEAVLDAIEADVLRGHDGPLAPPRPVVAVVERGRFKELFDRVHAPRTIMLLLFHFAQSIGLYGFANWIPTFLQEQGVTLTASLGCTLGIAMLTPAGPLLGLAFADRFERKWQIVTAAILVAASGLAFSQVRDGPLIVLSGSLVTIGATIISFNFHAYQSELYPTRIRALAIGFVYSASRLSGMLSGFLIAFALDRAGVPGALSVIVSAMGVIALSIAMLGPRTRGRTLEQINT